tara:strand:+ start:453 stop:1040 length:588 start_codon:yes stop_codon:yes gene_type:complete
MGININPRTKGNPVGRVGGRRTSIFVAMVISIIPLTSMFVYHLNPQISTDNPEQYQTDSGQYAYVVPNDGTPDTDFYFTYRDGSCIFTDSAETQSLWTRFTWHNTFWCVSGEEVMHRTPSSPEGEWYKDYDPVPVIGNQNSAEYVLLFDQKPETALLVTQHHSNSTTGFYLSSMLFFELFFIIFLFRKEEVPLHE